MDIVLNPGVADRVNRLMETGRYQNQEEVILDALNALDALSREDEGLRDELCERFDHSDDEDAVPLDVDAAVARLQTRLSQAKHAS
jgi:Arc/MetJ-type ribon-helix-helix transcriptional regulator